MLMSHILVTGGAGFIGSHLCDRLVGQNATVWCLDNFITGQKSNIAHLLDLPNFRLIEHDITTPLKLELFKGELQDFTEFTQIYHLACPASPVDYSQIPLQTLWTNAAGTKNVLDLAGRYDISLLLASSSEVYGDPQEHPQKESYNGNVNPVGPRSCYNESKRFAESMCINYWKHFQFPLKIVRIFNTYGPRMRKHDGRVIPEFLQQAKNHEPLRIYGDGNQTRSFCYIEDLVEGLLAVMNTPKDFIGPVNLGNPEEITINELAEIVIRLTDSSSLVSHREAAPEDPVRRCPDISLAKQVLGFAPKTGLEDGLKKTINY